MYRTIVILVLLVGLLGTAIWRRLEIRAARVDPPAGHVLLGWDTSTSYPRDCSRIVSATVASAIDAVPVEKDSTFSLIVTGGAATSSYEPRLVLSDIGIPRAARQGLIGVRREGASRAEFLEQVLQACESLTDETSTSLFRTLEIGLAHLGSRCPDAGLCLFIVGTDLRETVNREVFNYLERAGKGTNIPKLEIGAVRLVVCGYAESSGGGAPVEAGHQILERFRGLFSGEIELRPYCDGNLGTR